MPLFKELARNTQRRFLQAGEASADSADADPEKLETGQSVPRFTWNGCLCMQSWRLRGHEDVKVEDYCGNPDRDPGGEWCFVVDTTCQGGSNWGQCAPPPRCIEGGPVLAINSSGVRSPATLVAFHGRQVLLRWPGGTSTMSFIHQVATTLGQPCIHSNTPVDHGAAATSPWSANTTQLLSFDTARHGPPLALNLLWDFSEVLSAPAAFEESVKDAVAVALETSTSAVNVLAVMEGDPPSAVVAIGVLPDACGDDSSAAQCERDLFALKERWMWLAKLSSPLDALNPRDMAFPPFLDEAECRRRGLACPWLAGSGAQPAPVSRQADPFKDHSGRWWSMSVIAFAGATPSCLCFGLLSLKLAFHARRCMRRRRQSNEVRAEARQLTRLQVSLEEIRVGEEWLCSICLGDQAKGTDLLMVQCKHVFHYSCMLEWVQQRLSCPMCRTSVSLRGCSLYNAPVDADVEPAGDEAREAMDTSTGEEQGGTATAPRERVVSSVAEAHSDASDEGGEDVESPSTSRAARWLALSAAREPVHPHMVDDEEDT